MLISLIIFGNIAFAGHSSPCGTRLELSYVEWRGAYERAKAELDHFVGQSLSPESIAVYLQRITTADGQVERIYVEWTTAPPIPIVSDRSGRPAVAHDHTGEIRSGFVVNAPGDALEFYPATTTVVLDRSLTPGALAAACARFELAFPDRIRQSVSPHRFSCSLGTLQDLKKLRELIRLETAVRAAEFEIYHYAGGPNYEPAHRIDVPRTLPQH